MSGARWGRGTRSLLRFQILLLAVATGPVQAQAPVTGVDAESEAADRKRGLTGIPIPTFNEVMGVGLGVAGLLLWDVSKADTVSPPSVTAAFGWYSANDSWFAGAAQVLHFYEDRWRLLGLAAGGSINFQFSPAAIDRFIDYNSNIFLLKLQAKRRVVSRWYLGLNYRLYYTGTEFKLRRPEGDSLSIPGPLRDSLSDLTQRREKPYSGIGLATQWDSRDNQFNPSGGVHAELETVHNRAWLGSTNDYDTYELSVNYYAPVAADHVIASRFHTEISTGDVPFEDQNIFGGTDLRGYQNGRWRGNQVYALQSEWRWHWARRWGTVAFAGFGWAVDEVSEIAGDNILPSIGGGIRFMAVVEERVNVGLDVAVGREGPALHIMLTEAF